MKLIFLLFILLSSLSADKISVEYTEAEKKWIQENSLVKIAVMDYWPHDNNGESLHTSILKLLNKYGGINLVAARYDKWNEGFNDAVKGEDIHGIMGIVYSKERDYNYFDFTKPYDYIPMYIVVKNSNNSINSLDDLKDKTVYLKENSITNRMFMDKSASTNIITLHSIDKMYEKLSMQDEAQALVAQFIDEGILKKYSLKVVKKIYNKYGETAIAVNHKYPILYSIINKTLKKIPSKEISLLRDKVWGSSITSSLGLSYKQKRWLHGQKEIRVGIQKKWIPLSYEQNGEPKGLGVDYINLINKRLNGKLKIVADSFKNNLEKLKNNDIDAMIDITPTKEREKFYSFTKPYIEIPHAILINKYSKLKIDTEEDLNDLILSVEKGFRTKLSVRQSAPNVKFKEYDNTIEAIEALSRGETQAYIGNRAVANYILKKNFITNLKFTGDVKRKGSVLTFGVNKKNELLRDILQTAMDNLNISEKKALYSKYIGESSDIDILKKEEKLILTQAEKSWLKSNPMIKIAFMNYWHVDGKDNNIHSDLLKLLNRYGNINIVPARFDSWDEGFKEAAKGDNIHGIMNLSWSDEREKKYFDYTKAYNFVPSYLVVREDNKDIKSLEDLKNKTVYLREKAITHKIIKDISLPINIIDQNSDDLMYSNLSSLNEAQAILSYNIDKRKLEKYNLKLVKTVYTKYSEVSIGINHKHKILKSIIDKIYNIIPKDELLKLQNKTYKDQQKYYASLALSNDEKKWLNKTKKIKMCINPNWMPFEKLTQEGKYIGIGSDYVNMFSKKLGIPIELEKTDSWNDSLNRIKDKQCDILPMAMRTYQRSKYLNFTTPYISFPLVIVTHADEMYIDKLDDILDKKIGIVKGYATIELLRNRYPNIRLIEVSTIDEALNKVTQGELYCFIDALNASVYEIQKNKHLDLKISGKIEGQLELSIAVRNNNKQLLNIFQKLVDSIDEGERQKIESKWVSVKFEHGIDYTLLWQVLFGALIIFLIFVYWNRKLSQEIEQRKEAQEALGQSQKRLELALKGGDLGFWDIDFTTNKLIVNERWATMLGMDIDQLKDATYQNWLDSIHPQDLQRVLEFGQKYKSGKIQIYAIEYRAIRKDGHIIWLLSKGAIVEKDRFGKALRMVGTVSDITSKKDYEEHLMIAKEKAESATRAKSMFLARMSHEIRTPMNAVLGMLYLTQKTPLTPIQENYISKARNAADSLLHVINDILDFSKIEADKLDIQFVEFDFNEMISRITSVMNFKAEEKGIELLVNYDPDIPQYLISDSARIEQILINLIGNAIKFTHKGEVVISPKLISQESDTVFLRFCVKDSGIGISRSNQNKLFKDFSQVDESTTRRFGGSGLGLAISKKLSNLLGGDIWLESSSKTDGSVFCFNIKCKIAKTEQISRKIFPETLKDIKILIVDDNKVACDILSQMLETMKLKSDIVYSGEEALKVILGQKRIYDIIFMDYKMPGLDGIRTYQSIEEELKENTPETIMITAYSKDDMIDSISDTGIKSFLTKPVYPSLLFDTILHTLGKDELMDKITVNNNDLVLPVDSIKGSRVLLVEDNEINQEFAIILLESNGFIVDVANDGLEAIERVKTKKYDIIFMDIQMPNMDGLEASRQIRNMEDDYFKEIPIIALSAHAMKGDEKKSIDAGMNDHITKPIEPDRLFNTMLRFIQPKIKYKIADEHTEDNKELFKNLTSCNIDFTKGIQRAGDNQIGYMKILKRVAYKYEGFFESLERLIDKNDLNKAQRKVHEIKGVSGNIGAYKLFNYCQIIDDILKSGKTPLKEQLQDMGKALNDLIEEIQSLKFDHDIQTFKEFDKNKVLSLLDAIDENLEINIVEAEDSLEKLIPYMQDKPFKELSYKLTEYIENFDTDSASIIIKELKEILND